MFKTDDVDDLVDCMESIISDRGRLVDMGVMSYELVVSEHSPERYLETLLGLVGHAYGKREG